MAKYLSTVYVSGWQCSSTASTVNEPGPDIADYPWNTVPNKVDQLFRAQLFHARKQREERSWWPTQKQQTTQKNSFDPSGEVIAENMGPNATDVFAQAYKIAQEGSSYGRDPEITFAQVTFQDGNSSQMSFFDAQKIVAAYEGLNDDNRIKFCALLNQNATTYANALQFAQYNV
jgi:hypothetical protein